MSDIEGKKPTKFAKYCNKKKINFLTLEYSGHGKSYGKFTNGNISKWTNDAKKLINNKFKKKKFYYNWVKHGFLDCSKFI